MNITHRFSGWSQVAVRADDGRIWRGSSLHAGGALGGVANNHTGHDRKILHHRYRSRDKILC